MTTNKVSSESPFYFQLIHVNNIWNIKTVFMQNGYRMQWYGIFPPFLIRYLAQLGLLIVPQLSSILVQLSNIVNNCKLVDLPPMLRCRMTGTSESVIVAYSHNYAKV